MLAVRQLEPRSGDKVLDMCAAPGGKLTYIAQVMRNEGSIVAHDPADERLQLITENCSRLGITCVQTARAPLTGGTPAPFDRILIDAPCSNTGVMRRRVDLRWRVRPGELERLRTEQLALLQTAAGLLKNGGALVYSTCSLEPEENEGVIQEFLRANPVFSLEAERNLMPVQDGVDGAYVGRLQKQR